MKVKPSIPEWFERLPGDAALNASELADLLGYKGKSGLFKAINSGRLKCKDETTSTITGINYRHTKHYWKVSTIRKYLKDIGEL